VIAAAVVVVAAVVVAVAVPMHPAEHGRAASD
jgi:hypothetical protein